MDLIYLPLRAEDFDKVIELGCKVHGNNYLDQSMCEKILRKSIIGDLNCSYVVYEDGREEGKLVGFRLTYAPGMWEIDQWCSTDKWGVPIDKVCYFKSNTVDPDYRGQGIGSTLLQLSINTVKQMGAVAGATHIWMQSPGNSAFGYFTKNGGQLIKVWPSRWNEDCIKDGYDCVRCGTDCHCDAAEMMLYFGEQHE